MTFFNHRFKIRGKAIFTAQTSRIEADGKHGNSRLHVTILSFVDINIVRKRPTAGRSKGMQKMGGRPSRSYGHVVHKALGINPPPLPLLHFLLWDGPSSIPPAGSSFCEIKKSFFQSLKKRANAKICALLKISSLLCQISVAIKWHFSCEMAFFSQLKLHFFLPIFSLSLLVLFCFINYSFPSLFPNVLFPFASSILSQSSFILAFLRLISSLHALPLASTFFIFTDVPRGGDDHGRIIPLNFHNGTKNGKGAKWKMCQRKDVEGTIPSIQWHYCLSPRAGQSALPQF